MYAETMECPMDSGDTYTRSIVYITLIHLMKYFTKVSLHMFIYGGRWAHDLKPQKLVMNLSELYSDISRYTMPRFTCTPFKGPYYNILAEVPPFGRKYFN